MLSFHVDEGAEPEWGALFALSQVCAEAPGPPSFDPDDVAEYVPFPDLRTALLQVLDPPRHRAHGGIPRDRTS